MKIRIMRTVPFIVFILLCGLAHGQYHPDRHNTSYNDGWISCGSKDSPNVARGFSHWIMYDFGELYRLNQSHIWNMNSPNRQLDGVNEIVIDYSEDGQIWKEWGKYTVPQAVGSAFYEGIEGPDLTGVNARYVLITALSNHGGTCYGLSEIRFGTEGIVSDIADIEELPAVVIALPTLFENQTTIEISDIAPGTYKYSVSDITGRLITSNTRSFAQGKNTLVLDGSNWTSGIYVFSISDDTRIKSIRIQKIEKQ